MLKFSIKKQKICSSIVDHCVVIMMYFLFRFALSPPAHPRTMKRWRRKLVKTLRV